MKPDRIENNPELQRVLWACYKYWQGETEPPHERTICYDWVAKPYKERFGGTFHQSRLRYLTELGFLKGDDTARGGHRRYYKIIDPKQVEDLLMKCGLI